MLFDTSETQFYTSGSKKLEKQTETTPHTIPAPQGRGVQWKEDLDTCLTVSRNPIEAAFWPHGT